jgi:hypothetical protein
MVDYLLAFRGGRPHLQVIIRCEVCLNEVFVQVIRALEAKLAL